VIVLVRACDSSVLDGQVISKKRWSETGSNQKQELRAVLRTTIDDDMSSNDLVERVEERSSINQKNARQQNPTRMAGRRVSS